MYNRILNRPMFKRGGDVIDSQGSGITSGLDTPRSNYFGGGRTIGGGAFTGTPMGNRTGFKNIYESVDVSVPESTRKRAFWSGIGQGFGNNPKTLGEALSGSVAVRDQILGPAEAASAERQFQLDKGGIDKEYERGTLIKLEELSGENRMQVQALANEATATAQKIKAVKDKYLKDDGTIDTTNSNYIKEMEIITSGFNLEAEALKMAKILIQTQYPDLKTEEGLTELATQIIAIVKSVQKGLAHAKGGRVGYQFGTGMQGAQPTEVGLNVDETLQTPTGTVQEDVSVQEEIQPSVRMSYEEFRAKMPPQVDDDIVQLIYYNQDAFADFAQIKTQDEVYAFNNKWGVNLVLPFDTEIT
jgi:hypothetical protein